jgi:hypothetical protein
VVVVRMMSVEVVVGVSVVLDVVILFVLTAMVVALKVNVVIFIVVKEQIAKLLHYQNNTIHTTNYQRTNLTF